MPMLDRRAAYLCVGLLAGLIYANSLPNEFAYDDHYIVLNNSSVHSLANLPAALVAPYWPGAHGRELGLWRPVTTALIGVTWVAGGGSAFVFHSVNVVGHVVVSLLVLALLFQLLSYAAAFAAALVFAAHPVHVEAVANIVGVSEIVSAIALLAACLVHVRSGKRSSWRAALLIGALYAFGFGAKESAVTLPGIILLIDAARSRLTARDLPQYLSDRWRPYLVMFLVSMALLAARFHILGSLASPFAPIGAEILEEIPRIWTLSEIWTHYVRLWVFPLDLSVDYSPGVIPISFKWGAANLTGVLLSLLVLGISLVAWRRPDLAKGVDTGKTAAFGLVWFVITISPVSNTLFLSGVLLAERTLYLPSVGLAAATGWILVRVARHRPRSAWVVLIVVLLASSVRVVTRNAEWKDNPTVFTAMMRDYPHSGRSQWAMGDQLMIQGRVSEGLRSYRRAIALIGTNYTMMLSIGERLMAVDRYPAAETLLSFAAAETPQFPNAHGLLANIRAEHNDALGTEAHARTSLGIDDVDPRRHHLLAWALAAQGRLDEARAARERAEELGQVTFWQQYMYKAYVSQAAGDSLAANAVVDSAWARVSTDTGRASLDSVRVAEFGLPSLLSSPDTAGFEEPSR